VQRRYRGRYRQGFLGGGTYGGTGSGTFPNMPKQTDYPNQMTIRLSNRGYAALEVAATRNQTIKMDILREMIAFAGDHRDEFDAYVARRREARGIF
jgi:hypothetical protein